MWLLKFKKVKSGGNTYEYYYLVESCRKDGRPKQKVLMTLGRADDLDRSRIDEIVSALEGLTDKVEVISFREDCNHLWFENYVDIFVMEKLWKELKLD